jgi:hypothetical protein
MYNALVRPDLGIDTAAMPPTRRRIKEFADGEKKKREEGRR